MQAIDFLKQAAQAEKNPETVAQLENLYGEPITGLARNIFSWVNIELFFEDRYFAKLLSMQEILDASDDMNVDFLAQKIIPLIDTGDNDYISYRVAEGDWCRYNIVDELTYDIKTNILDYYL